MVTSTRSAGLKCGLNIGRFAHVELLAVEPYARLSAEQKAIIETDYGMESGARYIERCIKMRGALSAGSICVAALSDQCSGAADSCVESADIEKVY